MPEKPKRRWIKAGPDPLRYEYGRDGPDATPAASQLSAGWPGVTRPADVNLDHRIYLSG